MEQDLMLRMPCRMCHLVSMRASLLLLSGRVDQENPRYCTSWEALTNLHRVVCLLNGIDVYSRSDEELAVFRRREVGLVYQFYNLVPVLTAVENITLPVALDGREINKERLRTLIKKLGLCGKEQALPNQLSGGQQQRVAIGRALMNAPVVVLADEPTGNLDSVNSREIMELLRESNQEYEQALVVITHDEDIALAANRIIAIEDGRIVRDERIR